MDFMLLVLKLCSIQVVILLPLWIKLTMGWLLLFFCSASAAVLLIDGYILAIHQIIIQGAFAILFLIFSDLLNCLRSIGTMIDLYGYPRYLKSKLKYQQYGPCFQTIFPFMTMLTFRGNFLTNTCNEFTWSL